MNRWDIQKRIVEKSIKVPIFKKKLLSDPNKTLKSIFTKEEINYELLDKIDIKIALEKQHEWVIPIPDIKIDKISKNQLKGLSAGSCFSACGSCVCGSCCPMYITPCTI